MEHVANKVVSKTVLTTDVTLDLNFVCQLQFLFTRQKKK